MLNAIERYAPLGKGVALRRGGVEAQENMKNDHYTDRVTWSEEDGQYIGLCVAFPSLSWLASEQEEAFQGIRQLVADVMVDLRSKGEPIPEPLPDEK